MAVLLIVFKRLAVSALVGAAGLATAGFAWHLWRGGEPLTTVQNFLRVGGGILAVGSLIFWTPLKGPRSDRVMNIHYRAYISREVLARDMQLQWLPMLCGVASGLGALGLHALIAYFTGG